MKSNLEKLGFLLLFIVVVSMFIGYAVSHILNHFWPTLLIPAGAFYTISGGTAVFVYSVIRLVDHLWKK